MHFLTNGIVCGVAVISSIVSAVPVAGPAFHLDTTFQNQALAAHNDARKHTRTATDSVPPLTWNADLAAGAAAWSAKCQWGPLVHDTASGAGYTFGENLVLDLGTNPSEGIGSWVYERSQYDPKNPKYTASNGHYIQVVFKGVTSVGCGQTWCQKPSGEAYYLLVCRYNRGGSSNPATLAANVLPWVD